MEGKRRNDNGVKSCDKMVPLDTDFDTGGGAGGPVWHILSKPDCVLERGRRGDLGRRKRTLQEKRKCQKERTAEREGSIVESEKTNKRRRKGRRTKIRRKRRKKKKGRKKQKKIIRGGGQRQR